MRQFLLPVLILLQSACTNFIFVPYKPFPLTPDAAGISYEDIYINTADGLVLHGWKLFAEGKKAGNLLFFHGNGDNVSTQLPSTFWMVREGYDVYVVDYRGYGQSEGKAELDAVISDMELIIAYVTGQLPGDEKLLVAGHSLGGSMAIYAVAHSAYRERIKALVTIEAFSDYHDVTRDVLAGSWLTWLLQWPLSFTVDNSYRPLAAIGLVSPVPVLIMHSEADEMIDMYHAQQLYNAAKQPKAFRLIDGGHNNVFAINENRQVLLDYFKTLDK